MNFKQISITLSCVIIIMGTTIGCTSIKEEVTDKFNRVQPEMGNHEVPSCLNYIKEINQGFSIRTISFKDNWVDARFLAKKGDELDLKRTSAKKLIVKPEVSKRLNSDGSMIICIRSKYIPPVITDVGNPEYTKMFWIPKRDGELPLKAQEMIEDAAEKAGITLQEMSETKSSKISEYLSSNDITVKAKAPEEKMIDFINKIHELSPRFYWGNLKLSPDNLEQPKDHILLGTLRFVSIEGEEAADAILK